MLQTLKVTQFRKALDVINVIITQYYTITISPMVKIESIQISNQIKWSGIWSWIVFCNRRIFLEQILPARTLIVFYCKKYYISANPFIRYIFPSYSHIRIGKWVLCLPVGNFGKFSGNAIKCHDAKNMLILRCIKLKGESQHRRNEFSAIFNWRTSLSIEKP